MLFRSKPPKPIAKPIHLRLETCSRRTTRVASKMNKGTDEIKIEATVLGINCCAHDNSVIGAANPIIPNKDNHRHSSIVFGIPWPETIAKPATTMAASAVRPNDVSIGEKPSSATDVSPNADPQIMIRKTINTYDSQSIFMAAISRFLLGSRPIQSGSIPVPIRIAPGVFHLERPCLSRPPKSEPDNSQG